MNWKYLDRNNHDLFFQALPKIFWGAKPHQSQSPRQYSNLALQSVKKER